MTAPEGPLEHTVRAEIEAGLNPRRPIRLWMTQRRAWARAHPQFRWVYLGLVAVVGVLLVCVGLVLVPLPGPGWLVVFIGLAILGTEFLWARRLTGWTKGRLSEFWLWWRSRRADRSRNRR